MLDRVYDDSRRESPAVSLAQSLPMSLTHESELPGLLEGFGRGDPHASEQLMALLYSELYRLAKSFMAEQPAGHTLQATSLVSEAYLRLSDGRTRNWESRVHLMSSAARAMRCVLIDHARGRSLRNRKRAEPSALDRVLVTYEDRVLDLVALDDALRKLASFAPQMATAVELRFFAGLSMSEVAQALGIPKRTLERDWEFTRAWLFQEMS